MSVPTTPPQDRAADLQRNVQTPAPQRAEFSTILCKDCRHWGRTWPQANHAQCMEGTKFAVGGAPLLTTDLQTCSHAAPKI